ncbi:uncharacterized protein LOC133815874 isoform X1 [Humulus lupulus]|uniref:uncharacterized protein LOC133815874 isoform X1 n=1 Tax=Humulus lupulus TaxID=3486 RepID=UPI002B40EF8B|nr:uncharacterized protein LOC133815874 isoform X1 [Humulus lupulus]
MSRNLTSLLKFVSPWDNDYHKKINIPSHVFGYNTIATLFKDDVIQFCNMDKIGQTPMILYLRLLDDILHTNGLDHLYAFQHPGEVSVGHENKRAQALKDRFIQMGEKQFLICPWNNNAFTLYDTEKGKRVVSLKYYSPKCRQQPKTTECGIYCMKYARDLISQQRTRSYLSNNVITKCVYLLTLIMLYFNFINI